MMSQVAFNCETYTRSLFCLEQELKENPSKLQDNLAYLQVGRELNLEMLFCMERTFTNNVHGF